MNSVFRYSVYIFLFLFSYNTGKVSSQNYSCIKTDASYYFYDSTSQAILAGRIDSVAVAGNGTQYFGMRQIRPTDYGCFIPDGASWMGEYVSESPNGIFKFVVYPFSPGDSADVFTINSKGLPGETWHFYNYHTINHYVEAKVTQISLATFFGISDSVKTISLQRKNASGQNVSDPINGQKILLSKNYGLIRLPKFDDFNYNLAFYDLCGKTNPVTGITNVTFDRVFDFQPGDEIHIKFRYASYNYSSYVYEGAIIQRFIEKIPHAGIDTLGYKVIECSYSKQGYTPVSYTYFNDTVDKVFVRNDYPDLEFEPNESFILNNSAPPQLTSNIMGLQEVDSMQFSGIPWKMTEANGILWDFQNQQCWQHATVDGCFPPNYYYNGLGGPYFHCWDLFSMNFEYRFIKYYKKGNLTWGTPLDCQTILHTSTPEDKKLSKILISPNPVVNSANITISETMQLPVNVQINSSSGIAVLSLDIKNYNQVVDLSILPAGIYLARFLFKDGSVSFEKFIRQ